MADLAVSYDWLEQSSHNLHSIKRELDNIKENQDGLPEALGSDHMKHAMHDFCDNWGYHRRKLTEQVQTVGELCEKTMEVFRATDEKLAKADSGHGGKGHK